MSAALELDRGHPLGVVYTGQRWDDDPSGVSVIERQIRPVDAQREKGVRSADLIRLQDSVIECAVALEGCHEGRPRLRHPKSVGLVIPTVWSARSVFQNLRWCLLGGVATT